MVEVEGSGVAAKGESSASGTVLCEDGLRRPQWAARDELLRQYYDEEWGMPVRDETGVFERLVLEGFQGGLSWATVLRKRQGFRQAFDGFVPDLVAAYGEKDVERLLADSGIIRNRRKIEAAVQNAAATIALRDHGGLAALVWSFKPEQTPAPRSMEDVPSQSDDSRELAKTLKSKGFTFVGPTTMFALMEAIGVLDTHLVDSHRRGTSGVFG